MPAFLVLLSIAAIAIQILLGGADWLALTLNWGVAGVVAFLVWNMVESYRLGRNVSQGLIAVPWVLLSVAFNCSQRWFYVELPRWEYFLLFIAFYFVTQQGLRSWAESFSSGRMLIIGIIIGLLSTLYPYCILWPLFALFIIYHMRIFNLRNILSVFSGALMGVWVYFCLSYASGNKGLISGLLDSYSSVFLLHYDTFMMNDLWAWIALSFMVAIMLIFALLSMSPGSGSNLRSHTSLMLAATMTLLLVALALLDLTHFDLYLPMGILLLSLQLVIRLSDVRGTTIEWWTVFIVCITLFISVGPELFTLFKGF